MEDKFEALITDILEQQYATLESFISPELTAGLRHELVQNFEKGIMKPAGIGQRFSFKQNLDIRGDVIFWLEKEHNAAEKAFLEQVEQFITYLNSSCYTGINAYEFHFALYEAGSFYRRHLDQFKSDQGRKYSLIIYLNDAWEAEDGGQLVLYPTTVPVEIQPEGGRVVFFKADEVEHEVKPAIRPRMSIAGWLKRIDR
jgi:SM-20-related protein